MLQVLFNASENPEETTYFSLSGNTNLLQTLMLHTMQLEGGGVTSSHGWDVPLLKIYCNKNAYKHCVAPV